MGTKNVIGKAGRRRGMGRRKREEKNLEHTNKEIKRVLSYKKEKQEKEEKYT